MDQVPLHIVFAKPKLMIDAATTILHVDGVPVAQGSFTAGVDLTVPVAKGRHRIDLRIDLGVFARTRAYEIDVPGPTRLELRYSRLWGNFTRKPRVFPGG
ncbi:MAG TPA: hypothetical protein VGQ83_24300 [Polyangia bacterium]|jgi:hypothetical protein